MDKPTKEDRDNFTSQFEEFLGGVCTCPRCTGVTEERYNQIRDLVIPQMQSMLHELNPLSKNDAAVVARTVGSVLGLVAGAMEENDKYETGEVLSAVSLQHAIGLHKGYIEDSGITVVGDQVAVPVAASNTKH